MPFSLYQASSRVDLGHVIAIELLHSLFDLVFIGLDIYSEHKHACLMFSSWLTSVLRGNLMHGIVVKLVALLRKFELPLECLGPPEGG